MKGERGPGKEGVRNVFVEWGIKQQVGDTVYRSHIFKLPRCAFYNNRNCMGRREGRMSLHVKRQPQSLIVGLVTQLILRIVNVKIALDTVIFRTLILGSLSCKCNEIKYAVKETNTIPDYFSFVFFCATDMLAHFQSSGLCTVLQKRQFCVSLY